MDIKEFIRIERRIDAAEHHKNENRRENNEIERETIHDRWESGRLMLAERKDNGGKQLPDGRMAELVETSGKSAAELKWRMQFAEQCETEEQVATRVATCGSWKKIKKSLPKTPGRREGDPEHPAMTRAQEREFIRLHQKPEEGGAGLSWLAAEAVVRGFDKPRASLTTNASQVRGRYEQQFLNALVVDYDSLPEGVKKREAVLRRQIRKELENEIEPQIREGTNLRVEAAMSQARRMQADARRILDSRKGIMTSADYDLIRSCLHPDSRLSVTDEKLATAFRTFNALELVLLDEKSFPTASSLPSLDELRRMKQAKDRAV